MSPRAHRVTALAACLVGIAAALSLPAHPAAALDAPRARTPAPASSFAPAHTRAHFGVSGSALASRDGCAPCHGDVVAQWTQSTHAQASFSNPIYRVAVDRMRRDLGPRPSRLCAGCHDPALLVEGAMDRPVHAGDRSAHGGIGCLLCHGASGGSLDGNGSYELSGRDPRIPKDGSGPSVLLHKQAVALSKATALELCASCHRSFLGPEVGNPAHLVGQDDYSSWSRSPYAGSASAYVDDGPGQTGAATCVDCHMNRVPATRGDAAAKGGTIASHRFVGGNTALSAMSGDDDMTARVEENLRGSATVDLPVAAKNGGAFQPIESLVPEPGDEVVVALVLWNERVGHRFPGGVVDAQDTWVEVRLIDSAGRTRLASGHLHGETGADPSAHRLLARVVDEDGKPAVLRDTHRFRATVYDNTIPARRAVAVRYRFIMPDAGGPFTLHARVWHRARPLPLLRETCEEGGTPRGRTFRAETERHTRLDLDPCRPAPVTLIAERKGELGRGTVALSFRRWFQLGMALLESPQERVEEARPAIAGALATAAGSEHAMALSLLARLETVSGRTSGALDALDRASSIVGPHPSLMRLRGEVFAAAWRWREASVAWQSWADAAPRDDDAWAMWATALASAGEPRRATLAASRALALSPRNAVALRLQSQALVALGEPNKAAHEAFLRFRGPDDAPRLRALCAQDPTCARERIPVHVHELLPLE